MVSHYVYRIGQGVTGNQMNQGFCPVIEGIPKSFTHFFEIGLYGGLFLWSQKQGASTLLMFC